ncbi:hypothetical protein Tco_0326795 [Tanacetum coccineum]
MNRVHRSCNTTSRTLASIAIEIIVSLNFMLSQSISHALGYQCPDSSISHWGGGSGSDGGGSGGHARAECAESAYHCPRSFVSVVQQSESVTLSPKSVSLKAVFVMCGLLPATIHSQSGVLRP